GSNASEKMSCGFRPGMPAVTEPMTRCSSAVGGSQSTSTVQVDVPTPPVPSRETCVGPAEVGTVSVACRGPGLVGGKPTQRVQPAAVREPVQFCRRIGKSAASAPDTDGVPAVTALDDVSRTVTATSSGAVCPG